MFYLQCIHHGVRNTNSENGLTFALKPMWTLRSSNSFFNVLSPEIPH